MSIPQIDGQGNVLINGYYRIEGETFASEGLWYGGSGSLEATLYEGMQAPDLPPAVVIDFIADPWLSENRSAGFGGFLTQPSHF